MKPKNYYAVVAQTKKDGSHLCSQIGKRLFFFITGKNLPTPTLFPTKKAAKEAIDLAIKTQAKSGSSRRIKFKREIESIKHTVKKVIITPAKPWN